MRGRPAKVVVRISQSSPELIRDLVRKRKRPVSVEITPPPTTPPAKKRRGRPRKPVKSFL